MIYLSVQVCLQDENYETGTLKRNERTEKEEYKR